MTEPRDPLRDNLPLADNEHELAPDIQDGIDNARMIFVADDRHQAAALDAAGLLSTTITRATNGALETFAGANLVFVPCEDPEARTAAMMGASLAYEVAATVRVLVLARLEPGEGPAEWLSGGGTADALLMLADETELYVEVRAPAPPKPFQSKFGGVFAHDIVKQAVERDWLLEDVIQASSFSLVLGIPGCGKSFLILNFGMTASILVVEPNTKQEWFGSRIKPCAVVYISAEGQDDFAFRIKAELFARGTPDLRFPFYQIPTAIDMQSGAARITELIEEIKAVDNACKAEFGVGVGMLVIDTVNRSLAGGNENASEVMGAFVTNCGRIKEATGAATIGIHHSPVASDGGGRARGHSSLHGATDGEIIVAGASGAVPNSWTVGRLKAGPTGARYEFRLAKTVLGLSKYGKEITSCVVIPGGSEPSLEGAVFRDTGTETATGKPQFTKDGRVILRPNVTALVKALQAAIDEETDLPPVGNKIPHSRLATTFKRWLDEAVRTMPGDDKGPKFRDKCRKACSDAATLLQLRDIIGIDGDWVWRTQRRVANVDPVISDTYGRSSVSAAESSEIAVKSSETGDGISFL